MSGDTRHTPKTHGSIVANKIAQLDKTRVKRDEVTKPYSTNLRKVIETRHNFDKAHATKSVTFNSAIVETSFGGTQSPGYINDASLFESEKCGNKNRDAAGSRENGCNGRKRMGVTSGNTPGKTHDVCNGGAVTVPRRGNSSIGGGGNNGRGHSNGVTAGRGVPLSTGSTPGKITHNNNNQISSSKSTLNGVTAGRGSSSNPGGIDSEKNIVSSHEINKKLTTFSAPSVSTPSRSHPQGVHSQISTPSRGHLTDYTKHVPATPECFSTVAFETPVVRRSMHMRQSMEELDLTEDSSGLTVGVRVRPFFDREQDMKCVVSMIDNRTTVTSEKGDTHHFTYDYSFWSYDQLRGDFASQEHVYNSLAQPMLGKAFEGYNTCLFAYGQTGSGKSYSMMGHGQEKGIIPRFCEDLFARIESGVEHNVNINVEISYFEIYNEKIHDLLGTSTKDKSGKKPNLKVREHPVLGPYVEGLSSFVVKSYEDIQGWLNVGNKYRATAATGMNDRSSRSHAVYTMVMTQTRTENLEGEDHEHSITSKINLIDLAGSERHSLAKTSGERLREGASINKSLMALGKVITVLAENSHTIMKKKKAFIPYRDSVLTWMLKESLGGNSKTAMLATISPSSQHLEETLSTLRYAKQARTIINSARVNEDPKARLIRELRLEIEKLKSQTGAVSDDTISASLAEIATLKEKLMDKEKEMAEMTRSWQEKLKQSAERKLEEARLLEKSGIAFKINNQLPNLVNLNEDPQLSEMLLYVIREGQSRVGRMKEDSEHEIQLSGPLIGDDHCVINNTEKSVTITPLGDAPTYVNGDMISQPTILRHGDRVILGGDHYFRFNHPIEVQQGLRKSGAQGNQLKDFEFARQELIRVQNERLEAELEEARKKYEEEMAKELEKQKNESNKELEKKKQEAALQLRLQRHQYEDKLTLLERELTDHKRKYLETDQKNQQAEDMIKKLEQQKIHALRLKTTHSLSGLTQMLEQEVSANRKVLEVEAKATQQVVEESRQNHFKIVEQLEKEKQKIKKDVQRLEAIRLKRSTPTITPRPLSINPHSSCKYDIRTSLQIREANKISQYLKKDTVFSREDISDDGRVQTLVKVTNSKLNVSTFWTREKFEARLLQMREHYQGDAEGGATEADDLFYDPNDNWEKDERIESSPGLLPRLVKGLQRQLSGDEARTLSFDLGSSPESVQNRSAIESLRNRSALNSMGSLSDDKEFLDQSCQVDGQVAVMSLCRDIISQQLDTFKGLSFEESLGDWILQNCEGIKQALTFLLDNHNKITEDKLNRGNVMGSEEFQLSSLQLTCSLSQLLSHCSLWAAQYSELGSTLIKQLCEKITNLAKKVANQIVLFLQGCENDIDSMVQESSAQILDGVFTLSKHCGELSLATDLSLISLRDTFEGGVSRGGDNASKPILGHDIRQHFLSGCDVFIDKTLLGGLRTVEDCRMKITTYVDDFQSSDSEEVTEEVLTEVDQTTAACKVLLEKLQQVQVELDSTIRESSSGCKLENYYQRNYSRCQALVTHISNLSDGVSLLTQAVEPVVRGGDESVIRRLCRCCDMIQKATNKILLVSTSSSDSSLNSTDTQAETSELSVLSDSQVEQLEIAGQDVRLTTNSLNALIKKKLASDTPGTPGKTKRLLPRSPGSQKGFVTSPKNNNKDSIVRRNLNLVDLVEM